MLAEGVRLLIIGIGTDIVEVERIKNAIERTESFLNGAFTEDEIKYFNQRKYRPETIAGNFAAKEAISKALGTGFRKFGLKDIEILRDELGKPIANLSEKIVHIFGLDKCRIHISISHTNNNAIAYAVLEKL